MKGEIKELLDNLFWYRHETVKYQPEDILTIEDIWLLYDYITTLQEENERLNNIINELEKFIEERNHIQIRQGKYVTAFCNPTITVRELKNKLQELKEEE